MLCDWNVPEGRLRSARLRRECRPVAQCSFCCRMSCRVGTLCLSVGGPPLPRPEIDLSPPLPQSPDPSASLNILRSVNHQKYNQTRFQKSLSNLRRNPFFRSTKFNFDYESLPNHYKDRILNKFSARQARF